MTAPHHEAHGGSFWSTWNPSDRLAAGSTSIFLHSAVHDLSRRPKATFASVASVTRRCARIVVVAYASRDPPPDVWRVGSDRMADLTLDDLIPADFPQRCRQEASVGRVPFVLLRPDRGPDSPPEPMALVFGPAVPRVGESLLWENGEIYAVVAVTHRLTTDPDAAPYLQALPLLSTRPTPAG